MIESFSIIIGIVALFSYINYQWIRLPGAIGLMMLSLIFAGILDLSKPYFPDFFNFFCQIVINADFEYFLFNGLLSFLLFAGAIHINIKELAKERWAILLFATLGVVLSTAMVGISMKGISLLIGLDIPLVYMLLFGALISPTDPIAVLSILKSTNISKSLQLKIEGESLFNDGVGVVVFSSILLLLPSSFSPENSSLVSEIGILFAEEAIGGIVFGIALGFVGYGIINSVCSNPKLAVIVSLAIVMTGYALASIIHVSGPLAMVVCGLIIGNKLDLNHDKGSPTKMLLNEFWEVLEHILNGVLFVLMGLALHLIKLDWFYFLMGVMAIGIVLIVRYASTKATYSLLGHTDDHSPSKTIKILTWGGLRGGISIALALSLKDYPFGNEIILMTYIVVVFSILVQGLTIEKLIKKMYE